MYSITFADETGNLKNYVKQIAKNNGLKISRVETVRSKTFGDMVEIVIGQDDREIWRQLLSEFQVLTGGKLTLD